MNIRTEQVQALLQQQEHIAKRQSSGTDTDFTALLASQMELAPNQTSVRPGSLSGTGLESTMVGQMLLASAENTTSVSSAAMTTQQMYAQTNSALDMWDSYISALGGGSSANLRDAYALLDGVDSQVSTLKEQAGPALKQNPQLASIINELEVLTTTEKFKMNRGDYNS